MPTPEEEKYQRVMVWLQLADEDFRLAEHSFTMSSPVPYRLSAYHCQQSSEKYLKGILVHLEAEFPYTHNIERLLALLPDDMEKPISLEEAGLLTDYAVAKRYPDYYQQITKDEAVRAFKIAEKIKIFALKHLK